MNKCQAGRIGGRFGAEDEQRVHIIQGEYHVTDDPSVMLTTLLGSCVAACLRDPLAGVGGMNHFLLPGQASPSQEAGQENGPQRKEAERYGVHLMELLVNGLLRHGARRERLEAKLFGGARTMDGLADIGALNAGFAERFLRNEGIRLIGGSLRGDQGRRIQFWPVSGRARQVFLTAAQIPPPQAIAAHKSSTGGAVEFF
ncbi:chemotaxis protein CheD [Methylocapsa aurea]|uniref:chemotaxis protein CheD n=1 Tax=Methylocapsa aurea TaxID=663610 RepID=UPI000691FE0F|nr:chemotaxis protein CheD [Methylocapsa aurea]